MGIIINAIGPIARGAGYDTLEKFIAALPDGLDPTMLKALYNDTATGISFEVLGHICKLLIGDGYQDIEPSMILQYPLRLSPELLAELEESDATDLTTEQFEAQINDYIDGLFFSEMPKGENKNEGIESKERQELIDLLEVVARSQRDGPAGRISLSSAVDQIKAQNAMLRTTHEREREQITDYDKEDYDKARAAYKRVYRHLIPRSAEQVSRSNKRFAKQIEEIPGMLGEMGRPPTVEELNARLDAAASGEEVGILTARELRQQLDESLTRLVAAELKAWRIKEQSTND